MSTLPSATCPRIFDLNGGTRVFLVRAGPGRRSQKERLSGECDLSHQPDSGKTRRTERIQGKVAEALPILITKNSKFDGATIQTRPVLFHDGQPKSVNAYHIYKDVTNDAFRDGMVEEAGPDYFWTHGMNRSDLTTLTTIVVFCGTETIYRMLKLVNCHTRILVGSGAIIPIMFPIGAPPALALGMGPNAGNAMYWGHVTKTEHQDAQPTKKKIKISDTVT